MKKFMKTAALLLLAMSLLAGCDFAQPSATPTPSANANTPAATTPASTTPAATPAATPDATSAETSLERGSVSEKTYTNKYAGLTFEAPAGWLYATDEEIAAVMGIGVELLREAGVKYSETLLELQTITDMLVQNAATGTNLIVMYENLKFALGGGSITGEDYAAILKSQLEALGSGTYKYVSITTETIGGNDYCMLEMDMPEISVAQYYCSRKIDSYMLCIIITIAPGDDISDVLGYFK